MGDLAQFKEVHKIALPRFNKEVCTEAAVIGAEEEVLTPLPEEQETQKTLCGYVEEPERKMRTTLDGGGLGSAVPGTISVNQRPSNASLRS